MNLIKLAITSLYPRRLSVACAAAADFLSWGHVYHRYMRSRPTRRSIHACLDSLSVRFSFRTHLYAAPVLSPVLFLVSDNTETARFLLIVMGVAKAPVCVLILGEKQDRALVLFHKHGSTSRRSESW